MELQDAIDELITLAHNYQEDMSKWNGDNDGPMERAEERLGDGIENVLKNIINN